MTFFSLDQIEDVGASAGNFGKSLARGARDFACGLYKDYTGWSIGQAQQGTIGGRFVKGVWDTVCKNSAPGLPPAVPPCLGTWIVVIKYSNPGNNVYCDSVANSSYTVLGNGDDPAVLHSQVASSCGSGKRWFIGGTYSTPRTQVACDCNPAIVSRVYTPNPNCSPDYPYIAPPGNRLTSTYNYIYNDGSNITIPVAWNEIKTNLDISIDVGGTEVAFNSDGVHVNFDGDYYSTGILHNNVTQIQNSVSNMSALVANMSAIVNNVTSTIVLNSGTNTPDKSVDDIDRLAYVRVVVTYIPPWGDNQYGVGGPNVIYAGWFEFKKGSNYFPRQPIDFASGIFKAPEGADGYAYTLKNGYEGYTVPIQYESLENE